MVPGNTASRTFLGLLTQSIDIYQATSHVQGTTEDRTVSKAQFPPCLQEVHLHEGQEDKQRYKWATQEKARPHTARMELREQLLIAEGTGQLVEGAGPRTTGRHDSLERKEKAKERQK